MEVPSRADISPLLMFCKEMGTSVPMGTEFHQNPERALEQKWRNTFSHQQDRKESECKQHP